MLTVLQGKVWLIDFNPFGDVTDPLLFTWEELISGRNLQGDCGQGEALEQVRTRHRDRPVPEITASSLGTWTGSDLYPGVMQIQQGSPHRLLPGGGASTRGVSMVTHSFKCLQRSSDRLIQF